MLKAFVTWLVYSAVILLITYAATLLFALIPVPGALAQIISLIIWIVAAIICLFLLLRLVFGVTSPVVD